MQQAILFMPRLRDSLSLKIISLTLLLALMTLISAGIGVHSLNEFKDDYQEVKDRHLNALMKVSELRRQSQEIINASMEMFLATDLTELQSGILDISDKKLRIDKIIEQLQGDSINFKALDDLKKQLYSHLQDLVSALEYKFQLEDKFFASYRSAEALKLSQLNKSNMQLFVVMDKAISHFNPIINKNNVAYRATDLKALSSFINSLKGELGAEQLAKIHDVFIDKTSLASTYQDYVTHNDKIRKLSKKNEYFTSLFVSTLGSEVLAVQNRLLNVLNKLEHETYLRKSRLYFVLFISLIATFLFVLIQLNFIKRILLIRNIIDSGHNEKTTANFPIKGRDELSHMAKAIKNYIERLLKKEQEIITVNKQLTYLASHDVLTGIFNRHYFDQFLKQENERYLRYKEKYCVAMIDLDHFKKVNDNYGHDAGDAVLIDFSQRVLAHIRKTDVFARYGGEEFVLLMPNTVEKHALMLLERIREKIASEACTFNQHQISFSISVGLTEVQKIDRAEEQDKQLTFADLALYDAKNSGRNKVCVFNAKK